MALLKNKDRQGINALYDQYAPTLYGVVLRIVIRPEIAEETIQEVFLKIWKNIHSFDPGKGKLFTWMINIARNTAIDVKRSKDFRQAENIRQVENYVGIEGSTSFNINQIGLKEIVEKLPEEHRQVIDLVYFNGYTHKEVANELELPLGTVKTRVRIAVRELRKSMS